MDFLDGKDIALIGRKQNGVVLEYEKSIIITTDILRHKDKGDEPHMTFDQAEQKIALFAKNILMEGRGSNHEAQSIVYGESLVELLKWMIGVLKSHKHPPNGMAIPDFHPEANSRIRSMDRDLLNKHVQTR